MKSATKSLIASAFAVLSFGLSTAQGRDLYGYDFYKAEVDRVAHEIREDIQKRKERVLKVVSQRNSNALIDPVNGGTWAVVRDLDEVLRYERKNGVVRTGESTLMDELRENGWVRSRAGQTFRIIFNNVLDQQGFAQERVKADHSGEENNPGTGARGSATASPDQN
jgi:predicted transcriptional regulator